MLLILIIGVPVVVAAAAIGEFFIVQRGLDLLPLTPSPSRRSGSRIAVVKNESAPDSLSHGTPVEQPSPENCSQPAYVLTCAVGMARTGYCGNAVEGSVLRVHLRNRKGLEDVAA